MKIDWVIHFLWFIIAIVAGLLPIEAGVIKISDHSAPSKAPSSQRAQPKLVARQGSNAFVLEKRARNSTELLDKAIAIFKLEPGATWADVVAAHSVNPEMLRVGDGLKRHERYIIRNYEYYRQEQRVKKAIKRHLSKSDWEEYKQEQKRLRKEKHKEAQRLVKNKALEEAQRLQAIKGEHRQSVQELKEVAKELRRQARLESKQARELKFQARHQTQLETQRKASELTMKHAVSEASSSSQLPVASADLLEFWRSKTNREIGSSSAVPTGSDTAPGSPDIAVVSSSSDGSVSSTDSKSNADSSPRSSPAASPNREPPKKRIRLFGVDINP